MNLENLNLVELNAQEVQEVEGGIIDFIILGILVIGGGLILNNNTKKINGPSSHNGSIDSTDFTAGYEIGYL